MPFGTWCEHCERWHPNQEFRGDLCPGCESIGHTAAPCMACESTRPAHPDAPKPKKPPRRQTASSLVRAANTCAAVASDEIGRCANGQLVDALRVIGLLSRAIQEELLGRLPK